MRLFGNAKTTVFSHTSRASWATTSPGCSTRLENDISRVKSIGILLFS
jgi:hypothetical protein